MTAFASSHAQLEPSREPLPPGHPESWGAITAGTSLAESPYIIPADERFNTKAPL